MPVQKSFSRLAAIMVAAVVLAACTSTPLTSPRSPQGPDFQPLPPIATNPAQPAPQPARPATFIRPAPGHTIAAFDGDRNKGIDIAGKLGDPIVAAADGRVVYAGGGLRPDYGNMVILKHNDIYLTAYAHAQTIVVKEDDIVRQGQKIAEIGSSGTDRAKLHFEIRKQGVAVDPQPYLAGALY
jgi:lipoprotein NlpD